jgi:hypothetical protein
VCGKLFSTLTPRPHLAEIEDDIDVGALPQKPSSLVCVCMCVRVCVCIYREMAREFVKKLLF